MFQKCEIIDHCPTYVLPSFSLFDILLFNSSGTVVTRFKA